MAVNKSVAVRNAALDAEEVAIGASPLVRFFTGAKPASCAAASTGTLLVEMALPADWMAAAAAGAKSMLGTWQDLVANASGNGGYWRIFDTAGTTCHYQGTLTITGGGGDITLNAPDGGSGAPAIVAGQAVSISAFTITAGNA